MSVRVPETPQRTVPGAAAEEPELALHPGPREYIKVAVKNKGADGGAKA